MQINAMAHALNNSTEALNGVFGEQVQDCDLCNHPLYILVTSIGGAYQKKKYT
jgi:hypothetical protein